MQLLLVIRLTSESWASEPFSATRRQTSGRTKVNLFCLTSKKISTSLIMV